MPPSIPDRWIPYKACGTVIEGTRIICFKVPLRKQVQADKKKIKEIWDIETLLKKVPKLTAVIDLTNTSRYYSPKVLQEAGVVHKKILMPGRIIPPEQKVKEFMDWVDEFMRNNRDSVVGVHCTHGLNRTGYMVCRYMRDRLRIPAEIAIQRFEKARGYQIERENYKADLLGKAPPPPDLGKHTEIKQARICNMTYRTPLCEYEESTSYGRGYGYEESTSYGRGYNYEESTSYGRGYNKNRSTRDDSVRTKPKYNREANDSEYKTRKGSYDYKYDY